MTPNVDVHILVSPLVNHEWFKIAVNSVVSDKHSSLSCFENSKGIGYGRVKAYRQSIAEYVSYVDDDDVLLPGAIHECVNALDNDLSASFAFTLQEQINENGCVIARAMSEMEIKCNLRMLGTKKFMFHGAHHIIVYRREKILPYLSEMETFDVRADKFLRLALLENGKGIFVPIVGYQWRRHANQTSSDMVKAEKYNNYLKERFPQFYR